MTAAQRRRREIAAIVRLHRRRHEMPLDGKLRDYHVVTLEDVNGDSYTEWRWQSDHRREALRGRGR